MRIILYKLEMEIDMIDGNKYYSFNGNYHRDDGPAVEYANGSKAWWIHGKRHRIHGPAV